MITVIAYCLMPNHYHFLLRQDGETSIADCIQAIFNSYTKAFNKMYHRTGTLFEGRFQASISTKILILSIYAAISTEIQLMEKSL